MFDVVALGELLIDFAEKSVDENGYPLMKANPGGAPANFLGALNKYGKKTAFIGKVGDDAFGNLLIQTLMDAGINSDGVVVDKEYFTTLAFVTFNNIGERSFSFARKPGADTQLTFDEINLSIIDSSKIFHFGTLSLTTSPVRKTTKKAVLYAKENGKIISFDPNLRRPLWRNLDDAKKEIEWGLVHADFVKISAEEIHFLWGIEPIEGAKHILNEFDTAFVLLTLGPDGSIAMTKNACGTSKCPKVTPIDTTGAGDICGGGALNKIIDFDCDFNRLSEANLVEIAKFASTAASLSTEKIGGIPSIPNEEEILITI